MTMPEEVLMYDDLHGRCISEEASPNIRIIGRGCNFTLKKQKSILKHGRNDFYCTDFVIKNVTATCKYLCGYTQTHEIRTVVVKGQCIHTHT